MYFVSSVMYDWQNLRVMRSWKSSILIETATLSQKPAMPTSSGAVRGAVLCVNRMIWPMHSQK